jgi:hypothetical protein
MLFAASVPQSRRIVTRRMGRNPGVHGFVGHPSKAGTQFAGQIAQLPRRAGSAMQAATRP